MNSESYYEAGIEAFQNNNNTLPDHLRGHAAAEWQRGWNDAYADWSGCHTEEQPAEDYLVLERRVDGMLEGFYENVFHTEIFSSLKEAEEAAQDLDSANLMIVKFVKFI